MGTLNLHKMFNPETIAVIGASEKEHTVGHAIMKNLIIGGFRGRIIPVNPKYKEVMTIPCYPSLRDIKGKIDLAIIIISIQAVPAIMEECGKAGVSCAVIISSGGKEIGEQGRALESRIASIARKYQIRVIGPNCLGIINTTRAINASFAHLSPLSGSVAFISQSGAVCTSILDLAHREKIGFSHFISLGSMMDVDFADIIDYLGSSGSVKSIVMYMEHLSNIRNFMSAARAVSRIKPIVVLKSGCSESGARAAASHTGAMTGEDRLYDEAFRRAGILRVSEFEELLDCSQFLAKMGRTLGPNLTILTNAGGPGVMAADALESHGMKPTRLHPDTIRQLDHILPAHWSRSNPVDVLGDTAVDIYIQAAEICTKAPETNALLMLCAPAGTIDTLRLARKVVERASAFPCPVITAWIGADNVRPARQLLNQAGMVTFESAERAVRAFKNLYHYNRNMELLQQIPVRTDKKLVIYRPRANELVKKAVNDKVTALTEVNAKKLIAAYGIPVDKTVLATSEKTAVKIADRMGYPVALKISSGQISHKSDCGGVVLDVRTPEQVASAHRRIVHNALEYLPSAKIDGVTVSPYMEKTDYELIVGARKDAEFGPVILFGMGGVMAEIFSDTAIGLPPLNRLLARHMIEHTQISRVLSGFRNIKAISLSRLEEILIRVSRLVTDIPEITELDINPILVSDGRITAVDARVFIDSAAPPAVPAISTYPYAYERYETAINGQKFFIRPIRPSDADLLIDHFYSLSPRSVYMRFFSPVKALSKEMLIRLTQIDYDREIALVALIGKGASKKMIGVCRIILTADRSFGEFAVAISDAWHGQGIGSALLTQCLKAAKNLKVKKVMGLVLAENRQMLILGRKMGFNISRLLDCGEFELSIDLEKTKEM